VYAQVPAVYKDLNNKTKEEANKEFRFLAYFYNHVVNTNVYPTSDFLKGQVVGRLYGPNTSTTSKENRPFYFEQRILPFFLYSPKLFDGKATFRASFEIDFTWGDGSYGSGGNAGSAISADQVNLQTQNIEIELRPAKNWTINLGLQRMYDTPYDPYRTFFDKMLNTGSRLNLWGTDGVGIIVRRQTDFSTIKASYFQLYENEIQSNDDVQLFEFQYLRLLSHKWNLGASIFYVRDRGNGQGGPSILGQGLNSSLAAFNGTFRFPFGAVPYKSDVSWLGLSAGYNEEYMMDQLFGSAYVRYNLGTVSLKNGDVWEDGPSIGGLAANLRAGYRHGQTINDLIWFDAMYTTGDQNGIVDNKYSGVMTGNTWGTPGALHVAHGGYLLFPHANVVNRYIAAVTDISNMGYGISAIHINASKDIIPHKLNAKLGFASAISNAIPNGGGTYVGTEANIKVSYQLGVFMSLEFHAANLWLGDFYDSKIVNGGENGVRPVDPYTAFVSFKWLMF
jgi:hypothetical protein